MARYYNHNNRRKTYIDTKTEDNQIEKATDQLSVYKQALLDLFARSNSILAGQSVKCVTSAETQVACTDGETVYFSPVIIDKALLGVESGRLNVKNTLKRLAQIRGLNLHELAHILYSPRKGSVVWNEVTKLDKEIATDPNLFHLKATINAFKVWNLLEDLRIESLFASKYRNSIPYLHRTIVEILLGNDDQGGTQPDNAKFFHLWLYGRRYLPSDLRNDAREYFIKENQITPDDLAEWENIIDEYRSFVFPKDGRKVTELIKAFILLWNKYFPTMTFPDSGTGGTGTGGHGERRHGNADTQEQKDSQDRREEVEQEWEDSEDDDSDDEDNGTQSGDRPEDSDEEDEDDSDSDSDDDSDGDSDEDGDSNSKSDSDKGKNDNDSSGNEDSPSKEGADGNSKRNSDDDLPNQKAKAESALLKSLEDSLAGSAEQVQEDLTETLKQVLHRAEKLKTDILFKNVEAPELRVAPTPRFKAISNALNTALRQLRSDNEAVWERGVPTGRLNTNLAMDSEAQDSDIDVFDRWNDNGDDAPKVELVILLDQSGSMSTAIPTEQSSGYYSVMAEASASVWAIKLACQQNEIPCTVIGYSDPKQTAILYRAEDRVNNTVGIYSHKNYTDPSVALKVAHTIFSASDADNKILVSISDGEWSISMKEVKTINSINALGVDSIFIALPSAYNLDRTYHNGVPVDNGYKPVFSKGLDGTRIYSGQSVIETPPFYSHKVGIKVANPTELAKKVGKAVLKASRQYLIIESMYINVCGGGNTP